MPPGARLFPSLTKAGLLQLFAGVGSALLIGCVAYGQGGAPLWTNHFDGPAFPDDQTISLALDGQGNPAIVVHCTNFNGSVILATVKYANTGQPIWTNRYAGFTTGRWPYSSITVDSSDNLIVTGLTPGPNGYGDMVTIKYAGDGTALWTNVYGGSIGGEDWPTVITVDGAGNVYLTGYSYGLNTKYDAVLLKYAPGGNPLWTNRFGLFPTGNDSSLAMALDTNTGNIFTTGNSGERFSDERCVTIAYSPTGSALWTNVYGWKTNSENFGLGITVHSNVVFVGGQTRDSVIEEDVIVLAYSATGVPLWTNRYDGPEHLADSDSRQILKTDSHGSLLVASSSYNLSTMWDFNLLKYSSEGALIWSRRFDAAAHGDDHLYDMDLDPDDNIIVTGASSIIIGPENYSFYYDFATVAYSSAGVPIWTNRFNGTGNDEDRARAVRVAKDGSVFVAGYSYNGSGYEYVTIKYSAIPATPIPLRIRNEGSRVLLSWDNPAFVLQSAPTLSGGFTNITGAASPYTNTFSGQRQFFRLKHN